MDRRVRKGREMGEMDPLGGDPKGHVSVSIPPFPSVPVSPPRVSNPPFPFLLGVGLPSNERTKGKEEGLGRSGVSIPPFRGMEGTDPPHEARRTNTRGRWTHGKGRRHKTVDPRGIPSIRSVGTTLFPSFGSRSPSIGSFPIASIPKEGEARGGKVGRTKARDTRDPDRIQGRNKREVRLGDRRMRGPGDTRWERIGTGHEVRGSIRPVRSRDPSQTQPSLARPTPPRRAREACDASTSQGTSGKREGRGVRPRPSPLDPSVVYR
eukprot:scaffold846_cov336-Pavlova_lutheri.AAC.15